MNVSGADGGQFHHEKVISTALIFSGGLSGVAQRQMGGSFIRKCYIHCIYVSLTAIGKFSGFLWGSRGLLGVLGGSPEANGGQFYQEKVMSMAFIFLSIMGGLIELYNCNSSLTLF